MSTFNQAVAEQLARTENNMKAFKSTSDACTDLFFKIGAMRGQDVIPAFVAAYVQNPEVAVRIALWARDVRGGAGERKIFRDILEHLSTNEVSVAERILFRVPELGRWDDVFAATGEARELGFALVAKALEGGHGLAAKWMPRKGEKAVELRKFLGVSPKMYRKILVNSTKVVETQMCSGDWDNINYNHVPSLASSRYKKAFNRHSPDKFKAYTEALVRGDKGVKVNASAVYPYDVLKGMIHSSYGYGLARNSDKAELNHVQAQWDALPNYIKDGNVLALVDVSGSMESPVGGSNTGLRAIDVSVSLGLYCADKNTGKFKDTFLTFSGNPELKVLTGNILQKLDQMVKSDWGMNTNLHAALDKILSVAKNGNVPESEMPRTLLILSDMQFDSCVTHDDSAIEMMRRKYSEAGYAIPQVVFWNLNARDNVPVKFDESGTALISGFSPSIVKSVLGEVTSPEQIMLKTVMSDRYDF